MKYIITTILRSSNFNLQKLIGISIQSENFVVNKIWDFINYHNGWNKTFKTNESHHRNCCTVKPFHCTKTQEFPFKVEIFCYEENTGLLLRSNVARHPGR